MIDELDQAVLLRSVFPSYGPAWEAAIDYGIDVSLLLSNLDLTPTDRVRRLNGWNQLVRGAKEGEGVDVNEAAELLRRLIDGGVEFVVVGGAAARMLGAAMNTDDLDIAAPFTVENMRRLMAALDGLRPRYMMTMDKRPVLESPEQLATYKNLYLLTNLGRLDILGSVPPVGDYERIASRAEKQAVNGMEIRVIALEDLIAVKAHVGRPKDRHVEIELRAIQELRAKRGG